MPCTYFIDEDNAIAELSSFGTVTKEEILDRMVRLFNDPKWRPGYRVFSDYDKADAHDITSEDFDEILVKVIELRSKIGKSKFAFLVSTNLTYALSRMWSMKGGENVLDMACFRTRSEALNWLGDHEEIEVKHPEPVML